MSGTELAPGQPAAAGPSSAVVAAPTATDGAVDLSVHPSGIVPQLQCVRPLSALVRAHRPNLELFFFPPFARRSERCD